MNQIVYIKGIQFFVHWLYLNKAIMHTHTQTQMLLHVGSGASLCFQHCFHSIRSKGSPWRWNKMARTISWVGRHAASLKHRSTDMDELPCLPPVISLCLRLFIPHLSSQVTWPIVAMEHDGAFTKSQEKQKQKWVCLTCKNNPRNQGESAEKETQLTWVSVRLTWRDQEVFCVTPDNRSDIIGRHSEKKVEVPVEFPTNVVEWMNLERMMILALSSTEVFLLLSTLSLVPRVVLAG